MAAPIYPISICETHKKVIETHKKVGVGVGGGGGVPNICIYIYICIPIICIYRYIPIMYIYIYTYIHIANAVHQPTWALQFLRDNTNKRPGTSRIWKALKQ